MAKTLRCYLGFHQWQEFRAESGGWYKKCRECGKYRDIDGRPKLMLPS